MTKAQDNKKESPPKPIKPEIIVVTAKTGDAQPEGIPRKDK